MDQRVMQSPFLVGPRLYLRPLEPEQDAPSVARWNNDEQMRSYFNVYPTSTTRMKERLNQILAFHSRQPVEKISVDADRDFIMDAAQAREYGIVDQVISRRER